MHSLLLPGCHRWRIIVSPFFLERTWRVWCGWRQRSISGNIWLQCGQYIFTVNTIADFPFNFFFFVPKQGSKGVLACHCTISELQSLVLRFDDERGKWLMDGYSRVKQMKRNKMHCETPTKTNEPKEKWIHSLGGGSQRQRWVERNQSQSNVITD